MFDLSPKEKDLNVPQVVDKIEAAIYAITKPLGFRKHGRTLHRFVSGDLSQVINFQAGMPQDGMGGTMCVNLGIRIPECTERSFQPFAPQKKYYHEYNCTIRSRLGTVSGKREVWFDLRKNTDRIIETITKELQKVVLPTFDVLSSREAILAHRRDYPLLDSLGKRTILLDECMIYGHLGNMEKAKELFDTYYCSSVEEYENECKNGRKIYLKKGQRVLFMNQDITAEKDGYVTLYGGNRAHIDYLDKLRIQLGFQSFFTEEAVKNQQN